MVLVNTNQFFCLAKFHTSFLPWPPFFSKNEKMGETLSRERRRRGGGERGKKREEEEDGRATRMYLRNRRSREQMLGDYGGRKIDGVRPTFPFVQDHSKAMGTGENIPISALNNFMVILIF